MTDRSSMLRARGLPPGGDRGYYDPAIDRRSLYSLPQRSRFWPGSDSLQGDEWQRCYGDISIPGQLQQPRRRPSCLQDEQQLNKQLLQQLSRERQDQEALGREVLQRRHQRAGSALPADRSDGPVGTRQHRSSSVQRTSAFEEFSALDDKLSSLRAAKSDLLRQEDCLLTKERVAAKEAARYLQAVQSSSAQKTSVSKMTSRQTEESSYLGLDGTAVHLPRWAAQHPIRDSSVSRQPPVDSVWPEKRPFYDLKNDYSAVLSFMGVPRQ